MERALQDEVWSMLPKEFKEEVKKEYKQPTKTEYEQGYDNALRNYFGHHNLTSDDNANANAKAEPKKFFDSDYSIGDKVVVNISSLGNPRKEVVTLVRQYQPVCEYSDWEKTWVIQARDGMTYQSKESHFEPYTEPSEPKSDDMEEKELKVNDGVAFLDADNDMRPGKIIYIASDGGIVVVVTPNEEVHLVPIKNINPKPKRWKPAKGEKYWYINELMNVTSSLYNDEDFDAYTKVESTNNCFQSFELAQQAAEEVKATLEQFHKSNQQ